jgi:ABC-type transport system involved in cytochrome c biogenesis permease subunit
MVCQAVRLSCELRFLRAREKASFTSSMKRFAILSGFFLLVGILVLRADNVPLDTDALATLAVQDHGRKKPFTTFAKETVLTLSGHSTLTLDNPDGSKTKLSPEEVILDLWFKPEGWDERPVIMLNFLELKQKLGLPEDRKTFSFNELIKNQALLGLLDDAQKQQQAGKGDTLPALLKEAQHLGQRMQLFRDLVDGTKETIVPNLKAADASWSSPYWSSVGVGILGILTTPADTGGAAATQASSALTTWDQAYRANDIDKFNAQTFAVVDSLRAMAPQFYPSASSLRFEHQYMVVDPFLWAWIIYFVALLVLLFTALWATRAGYLATWALVGLGLAFEIYGFVCRTIISGRPPVTDLYETVIWVSFIGMVFAVILEAVYRKRYFFYAGLPAAILTLIVADSDSTILDASINPLTAVLRDNMWLTIHVLTIVSSYAAFALTAALGHIALVMTFWGKRYAKAQAEVTFFIYRAMQIGILLLATGTILGGVWANYSWGRFWGWDPKETWALITLLCYLALLHGRLAGWWKGFGLAVGSVVCFLSVMMSWYGVNFILGQNGKSLHSYGLSTGGLGYASSFAGLEILFVFGVVWWNKREVLARKLADRTQLTPKVEKGLAGEQT